MNNISKKTCFSSTRKVLDFDLNGQHMRKTEVPQILSLKSQPSPKDKSERLASRRKVVSSAFDSLVVWFFLLILSIVPIYFEFDCLRNLIFADFGPTEHSRRTILTFLHRRNMFRHFQAAWEYIISCLDKKKRFSVEENY